MERALRVPAAVLCLLLALLCTGCIFDFDTATTTPEADLPDSDYMKTLTSESSITLTGVQGKAILYANFNTSGSSVVTSPRYLVNATGTATGSLVTFSLGTSDFTKATSIRSASYIQEPELDLSDGIIRHFEPKQTFSFDVTKKEQSRSALYSVKKTETNFTVGQTKSFYVDNNVNLDSYEQRTFQLAAKGSDAEAKVICLVWVDTALYAQNGTAAGETVNQAMAASLASTFAQYYAKERAVFGNECEYLFNSSGYALSETMEYNSDTGSLVNIVIYDIGNDYVASNNNYTNANEDECGVVGYFYSKDYYAPSSSYTGTDVRKYSNGGKFFYIDAAFCNLSAVDGDTYQYGGAGGNKVSDTVVSTLFHEFQHMLNFGQKDVYGVKSPTWYNEMLSMLAEDMMQASLGLSAAEAPRGARLPAFNKYYWYSGIDEYRDKNSVLSYSTAYSFGAWLARTYGGPEFVSAMSKNRYGGMDSVKKAIASQEGTSLSSLQIFKLYLQACAFRTSFAADAKHLLPSHYQDGGGEMEGFKMSKINLFGSSYGYEVSDTKYYGPLLFGKDVRQSVRPHGFTLHAVGVASSDTVTLTFSSRVDANEQIVVFVQDGFGNSVADGSTE